MRRVRPESPVASQSYVMRSSKFAFSVPGRFTAIFLGLALAASAQQPAPAKSLITSDLGGRELTFLQKANEHGLVLMYLANLAKTKGGTEPIKALGDLLATTQAKEHEQLIALAASKGLTLDQGEPGAVPRLKTLLDPLEKGAFDRAWFGEISAILRATVQNFSSGAGVSDPAIKKHAADGLALANQKLEVVAKIGGR